MFFPVFLFLQLTALCLAKYEVTEELKMMLRASPIITITIDESVCRKIDEARRVLTVDAMVAYMYGVDSNEIDRVQEKIFYVYNNHRAMKDSEKLYKVKENLNRLYPNHKWSIIVIKPVASSVAHDKFFTFHVSCKYVIGIAGIKC